MPSTKVDAKRVVPVDVVKPKDAPCWTQDAPGALPILICKCGKPINLKNAVIKADGTISPDINHGCDKKGPLTFRLVGYQA